MSEIWVLVSKFIRFKSIFPFKHEQIDLHSQISSHVSQEVNLVLISTRTTVYERQTNSVPIHPNVLFS